MDGASISERFQAAYRALLEPLEEFLAIALGQALGLGRPMTLLEAKRQDLRQRIKVIETADGERWYYVDGVCAFGTSLLSRWEEDDDGALCRWVFATKRLDPADAPAYPGEQEEAATLGLR